MKSASANRLPTALVDWLAGLLRYASKDKIKDACAVYGAAQKKSETGCPDVYAIATALVLIAALGKRQIRRRFAMLSTSSRGWAGPPETRFAGVNYLLIWPSRLGR